MSVATSAALCAGFAGSDGVLRGPFLVVAAVVPSAIVASLFVGRRERHPLPWVFVLFGLVLLTVNSIAWLVQLAVEGRPVATGAVVTAAVLLGYLSLLVAASIVVSPFARLDAGGVLDAAIIGRCVGRVGRAGVDRRVHGARGGRPAPESRRHPTSTARGAATPTRSCPGACS